MAKAKNRERGNDDPVTVLVPCASRKNFEPVSKSRAVSLPIGRQGYLENAWLKRLETLLPSGSAETMYAGRSFQLAKQAASASRARFFVISAGLGLVAGETQIPAYGITLRGTGTDSIVSRITGKLDVASWWRAVGVGPFATSLASVFAHNRKGAVVAALTRPYAEMLAEAFDNLPAQNIKRLRIIGTNLAACFSPKIASCILPYDERFDAICPGTRGDFPQRALKHFVVNALATLPHADMANHSEWVRDILAEHVAPEWPERPRLPDDEITKIIERHIPQTRGVGRMLRILRDDEGVACEQARFTRLYRSVVERVNVS